MADFDGQLAEVCIKLIEENRMQLNLEVEEYLNQNEKYAQFKDFTAEDHLSAQAILCEDFKLPAEM